MILTELEAVRVSNNELLNARTPCIVWTRSAEQFDRRQNGRVGPRSLRWTGYRRWLTWHVVAGHLRVGESSGHSEGVYMMAVECPSVPNNHA